MSVQGILNRPRLDPNFESVLGFDVLRNRIVAQTRGKVPQQHATAVQRPHRIFRRLSITMIGRRPIGHLAGKQEGVLHMGSSEIRSNRTRSDAHSPGQSGRTARAPCQRPPIKTSGLPTGLERSNRVADNLPCTAHSNSKRNPTKERTTRWTSNDRMAG